MEKWQQSMVLGFCAGWMPNDCSLDHLAQKYYLRIKYYFSCHLDCDTEVEQLTREAFRIAKSTLNQNRLHRIDDLLLSIAADLLRHRWLKYDGPGFPNELEKSAPSLYILSSGDLQDQAATLYIKLRALQGNPIATAEICATIHRWIGNDPQRQAAYDRVRRVWYRKRECGRSDVSPKAHSVIQDIAGSVPISCSDTRASDSPTSLSWQDVVLLVFVFMLLLPMIYLLAVPVGGRI